MVSQSRIRQGHKYPKIIIPRDFVMPLRDNFLGNHALLDNERDHDTRIFIPCSVIQTDFDIMIKKYVYVVM